MHKYATIWLSRSIAETKLHRIAQWRCRFAKSTIFSALPLALFLFVQLTFSVYLQAVRYPFCCTPFYPPSLPRILKEDTVGVNTEVNGLLGRIHKDKVVPLIVSIPRSLSKFSPLFDIHPCCSTWLSLAVEPDTRVVYRVAGRRR